MTARDESQTSASLTRSPESREFGSVSNGHELAETGSADGGVYQAYSRQHDISERAHDLRRALCFLVFKFRALLRLSIVRPGHGLVGTQASRRC